jgi:hypothetical protein
MGAVEAGGRQDASARKRTPWGIRVGIEGRGYPRSPQEIPGRKTGGRPSKASRATMIAVALLSLALALGIFAVPPAVAVGLWLWVVAFREPGLSAAQKQSLLASGIAEAMYNGAFGVLLVVVGALWVGFVRWRASVGARAAER